MTDERGGRYFREARFFLAGDKVAAQSHILEARSLMGYMRDMHSLGGPPIQVKYATLQDGTQIKATMMNGQYQAEIISPFGGGRKSEVFVPTLAGHETMLLPDGVTEVGTKPFKWQRGSGLVYLGRLPTHDFYHVTKVSDDGSVCAGYARVNGGPVVDGLVAFSWVVWDSEGVPSILGDMRYADTVDVRYGDPVLFPMPAPFQEAGDYQTQRVGPNDLLFMGATADPADNIYYATATKVALDPPSEQVLVVGPEGANGFSSASRDIRTLFFTTDHNVTHSDGGIYQLRAVRKAVLNNATGAYEYDLSAVLHPALESTGGRPFCDAVGDAVVASEVEHYPESSFASSGVPAVYTQSTGELIRLEQHTGYIGVYNRIITPRAMCSDGTLVAGVHYDNTTDYAIAWQKVRDVWSHVPGLGSVFRGQTTAAN